MDLEKLWKPVLAELELSVSKTIYQTCFAQTRLISLVNDVASVGVASPLMRTLIETRYYSLVKSVVDHHARANTSLVFIVSAKRAPVGYIRRTLVFPKRSAGADRCSRHGPQTPHPAGIHV